LGRRSEPDGIAEVERPDQRIHRVAGELPIVPEPRVNRRVMAVIQPSPNRILAKVSVKDKDARGGEFGQPFARCGSCP
jgi:hypothetical protein